MKMKKTTAFLIVLFLLTSCQSQFVRELTGEVHLTPADSIPTSHAEAPVQTQQQPQQQPQTERLQGGNQPGLDYASKAPSYKRLCEDADIYYSPDSNASNLSYVYTAPKDTLMPLFGSVVNGMIMVYPLDNGAGHFVQASKLCQ